MIQKLLYISVTLLLFAALSCTLVRPAYGYVDPGSSLVLYQSISAIITGSLFYFRRRLKSLFHRRPSGSAPASTEVR